MKGGAAKFIPYLIILILLVAVGYLWKQGRRTTPPPEPIGEVQKEDNAPSITITEKEIKEENFSGKVAVIKSDSLLAKEAQKYIDQTVAEFKAQADKDVPEMRRQFGTDSPSAQYEINIDAKNVTSMKTDSVEIGVYTYTGGAHGSSYYKVMTVGASQEFLSLSQVIKKDKQAAFTALVKKELLAYRLEGMSESPVFPDEVNNLKFESFSNWALDNDGLILYFAQYEVGPGALGAFKLPISKTKIESMLNDEFLGS